MCGTSRIVSDQITHVIFDFDGLLVDTEPIYTIANTMMLNRYGKQFTMELKAGQMGRKHDEAIEYLLNECGISHSVTVEEYGKDYDKCLFELFRNAPARAGAEQLVRHFADKGLPLAICTGSDSTDFPIKSAAHTSWINLIPLLVLTGDDPLVKRGKPHPDGFLETMRRFPIPPASPSNCLVFEDAPNGVRSALAAGMHCVMVPDPVFRPDAGFASQITQVLDSLEDFKPEQFGLPPFQS